MANWETCSSEIKDFVFHLLIEFKEIFKKDFIGCYLHGSLAMGGFNPNRSDIDILIVTSKSMDLGTKRRLAQLCLTHSSKPFPIEISCLNENQLKNWSHPSPFDFHYSEFWRKHYENDLANGTYHYLNEKVKTDADLAAHITITTNRGICIEGKPIGEVFPLVPSSHYISSIMGDFEDCLVNIEEDPVYCTLNIIRVFWYLNEGVISSKLEAGNWGLAALPKEMGITVKKAVECYEKDKETDIFNKDELLLYKNYILDKVQRLINQ
ncbi:aminoglycoside adenylyltransferase domain-containing protein [Bacillus sp. JJ1562]|uniref:aminoglycoside adenylyltransferase domain-containing protein n=1 Tax=Bacillus sp. JJ1562 TaxID=3122960 RepID=UPI0030012AF7